ncbi:MAG: ThiF family adenylyltransferase [bacterium]
MNNINPIRHIKVFDPHVFGNKRVDIIGCGSTGSRIVMSLAKLGIENLHIWDFDIVEAHNIANQIYQQDDIGKKKVDALAEHIKRATGLTIHTHPDKVDGTQKLGEIVFLLTDTMSSRKEIWEKGIRYQLSIKLMVETRMGSDNGRVYAINPCKCSHTKAWEDTLHNDDIAEISACGASISVGPTAEIVSGLAVWQFLRWFSTEQREVDELDQEILFSLRPMQTLMRQFI